MLISSLGLDLPSSLQNWLSQAGLLIHTGNIRFGGWVKDGNNKPKIAISTIDRFQFQWRRSSWVPGGRPALSPDVQRHPVRDGHRQRWHFVEDQGSEKKLSRRSPCRPR
jgi:hypothetical protein